ncbi:coniferyl aldehyde dehydrogenase [Spongiibacter marinus]|uniref:coniferyl aldehyde dehydrogenase n=1 Tax=Spongiibacter marinus TaxID=354246 RepID=UPI0035BE6C32
MNTTDKIVKISEIDSELRYPEMIDAFSKMKTAHQNSDFPSYQQRLQDLMTLKNMLVENRDTLTEAICQDYGNRSWHETTFGEFIAVMGSIDYLSKHLKKWMAPRKKKVDPLLFPAAKNRIYPQPLGVVGIIVPWNGPINLSMVPAATALAAGNRIMIKMSENSRNTCKVLKEIVPNYFSDEKILIIDETGGVGVEFSKIPFDLIMFTGSVQTGKAVMAAAAKNLTPVILELGGKSPAVIDPDYPIQKAAQRIAFAKQFNAGQVCLNVDYLFVHHSQLDEFVNAIRNEAQQMVPNINGKDYTSIIDERSFKRLSDTLIDAELKGATVINISNQPPNLEARKFPLHLVLNASPDMIISQRETFGPILMIHTYNNENDVIEHVNAREKPLGFYVFSDNSKLVSSYISKIMSGGVTVNDTMLHAFQDDMQFGGIGHSGMGHYHGEEGFMSFSKMRPVFYQPRHNPMSLLKPPYPNWVTKAFNLTLKIKG